MGRTTRPLGEHAWAPVLPVVVDLHEPLPSLTATRPAGGAPYARARCLVLLDGEPLGWVDVDLPSRGLGPHGLAARLWCAVGEQVVARRLTAGGPVPRGLPVHGLPALPPAPREAPAEQATVVIATRDRPHLLEECLRSLWAGTTRPAAVVVVDNAPSDDVTEALVRRLADSEPTLTYVREPRPGLAWAHNAGLPHVRTPIVAFTDDDVVVHRAWLERVVAAFGGDEQVGCVTGLIAPYELETLTQQWIEAHTAFSKGFERRRFDTGAHRPADPLFPYAAGRLGSGANMAFRTAPLVARGGFDERLGAGSGALGGDDLAAFYDVVRDGLQVVYEPGAIVLHRHHRELEALRRQAFGYGVGLGAHLTRCVLRDPRAVARYLRAAPGGLRRAAEIAAPPPHPDLPPYPSSLSRRQWAGIAAGPVRYLRSAHRPAGQVAR